MEPGDGKGTKPKRVIRIDPSKLDQSVQTSLKIALAKLKGPVSAKKTALRGSVRKIESHVTTQILTAAPVQGNGNVLVAAANSIQSAVSTTTAVINNPQRTAVNYQVLDVNPPIESLQRLPMGPKDALPTTRLKILDPVKKLIQDRLQLKASKLKATNSDAAAPAQSTVIVAAQMPLLVAPGSSSQEEKKVENLIPIINSVSTLAIKQNAVVEKAKPPTVTTKQEAAAENVGSETFQPLIDIASLPVILMPAVTHTVPVKDKLSSAAPVTIDSMAGNVSMETSETMSPNRKISIIENVVVRDIDYSGMQVSQTEVSVIGGRGPQKSPTESKSDPVDDDGDLTGFDSGSAVDSLETKRRYKRMIKELDRKRREVLEDNQAEVVRDRNAPRMSYGAVTDNKQVEGLNIVPKAVIKTEEVTAADKPVKNVNNGDAVVEKVQPQSPVNSPKKAAGLKKPPIDIPMRKIKYKPIITGRVAKKPAPIAGARLRPSVITRITDANKRDAVATMEVSVAVEEGQPNPIDTTEHFDGQGKSIDGGTSNGGNASVDIPKDAMIAETNDQGDQPAGKDPVGVSKVDPDRKDQLKETPVDVSLPENPQTPEPTIKTAMISQSSPINKCTKKEKEVCRRGSSERIKSASVSEQEAVAMAPIETVTLTSSHPLILPLDTVKIVKGAEIIIAGEISKDPLPAVKMAPSKVSESHKSPVRTPRSRNSSHSKSDLGAKKTTSSVADDPQPSEIPFTNKADYPNAAVDEESNSVNKSTEAVNAPLDIAENVKQQDKIENILPAVKGTVEITNAVISKSRKKVIPLKAPNRPSAKRIGNSSQSKIDLDAKKPGEITSPIVDDPHPPFADGQQNPLEEALIHCADKEDRSTDDNPEAVAPPSLPPNASSKICENANPQVTKKDPIPVSHKKQKVIPLKIPAKRTINSSHSQSELVAQKPVETNTNVVNDPGSQVNEHDPNAAVENIPDAVTLPINPLIAQLEKVENVKQQETIKDPLQNLKPSVETAAPPKSPRPPANQTRNSSRSKIDLDVTKPVKINSALPQTQQDSTKPISTRKSVLDQSNQEIGSPFNPPSIPPKSTPASSSTAATPIASKNASSKASMLRLLKASPSYQKLCEEFNLKTDSDSEDATSDEESVVKNADDSVTIPKKLFDRYFLRDEVIVDLLMQKKQKKKQRNCVDGDISKETTISVHHEKAMDIKTTSPVVGSLGNEDSSDVDRCASPFSETQICDAMTEAEIAVKVNCIKSKSADISGWKEQVDSQKEVERPLVTVIVPEVEKATETEEVIKMGESASTSSVQVVKLERFNHIELESKNPEPVDMGDLKTTRSQRNRKDDKQDPVESKEIPEIENRVITTRRTSRRRNSLLPPLIVSPSVTTKTRSSRITAIDAKKEEMHVNVTEMSLKTNSRKLRKTEVNVPEVTKQVEGTPDNAVVKDVLPVINDSPKKDVPNIRVTRKPMLSPNKPKLTPFSIVVEEPTLGNPQIANKGEVFVSLKKHTHTTTKAVVKPSESLRKNGQPEETVVKGDVKVLSSPVSHVGVSNAKGSGGSLSSTEESETRLPIILSEDDAPLIRTTRRSLISSKKPGLKERRNSLLPTTALTNVTTDTVTRSSSTSEKDKASSEDKQTKAASASETLLQSPQPKKIPVPMHKSSTEKTISKARDKADLSVAESATLSPSTCLERRSSRVRRKSCKLQWGIVESPVKSEGKEESGKLIITLKRPSRRESIFTEDDATPSEDDTRGLDVEETTSHKKSSLVVTAGSAKKDPDTLRKITRRQSTLVGTEAPNTLIENSKKPRIDSPASLSTKKVVDEEQIAATIANTTSAKYSHLPAKRLMTRRQSTFIGRESSKSSIVNSPIAQAVQISPTFKRRSNAKSQAATNPELLEPVQKKGRVESTAVAVNTSKEQHIKKETVEQTAILTDDAVDIEEPPEKIPKRDSGPKAAPNSSTLKKSLPNVDSSTVDKSTVNLSAAAEVPKVSKRIIKIETQPDENTAAPDDASVPEDVPLITTPPALGTTKTKTQARINQFFAPKGQQPSVRENTCGSCKAVIPLSKWNNHVAKHTGLTWIEGVESPIDLEDDAKLNTIAGRFMSSNRRKEVRCFKCGEMKKSACGLVSHMRICGLDGEEARNKKVACSYCSKAIMPASFNSHYKYCAPLKKLREAEAKEAASKKAEKVREEEGANGSVMVSSRGRRIRPTTQRLTDIDLEQHLWRRHFQKSNHTRWVNDEKRGLTLRCFSRVCDFETKQLRDMEVHHNSCEKAQLNKVACRLCSEEFVWQGDCIKHVREKHFSEEKKKASDDEEEEEDKDESDASVGVESSESEGESGDSEKDDDGDYENEDDEGEGDRLSTTKRRGREIREFRLSPLVSDPYWRDSVLHRLVNFTRKFETFITLNYSKEPLFEDWKVPEKLDLVELPLDQSVDLSANDAEINCGLIVESLAWVPMPVDKDPQILALLCKPKGMPHMKMTHREKMEVVVQMWQIERSNGQFAATHLYSILLADGPICAMRFCPSGGHSETRLALLALTSVTGDVNIVALPQPREEHRGKCLRVQPSCVLKGDMVNSMGTSLDWDERKGHSLIAAGYMNGMIALWKIDGGSRLLVDQQGNILPIKVIQAFSVPVSRLGMNRGYYLAVAGPHLKVFEISSGFELQTFIGSQMNITCAAWIPNSPYMMLGLNRANVSIGMYLQMPLSPIAEPFRLVPTTTAVTAASFSPNLGRVVLGTEEGEMYMRSLSSAKSWNAGPMFTKKLSRFVDGVVKREGQVTKCVPEFVRCVDWNRSPDYEKWYAVGYELGMVRVNLLD